MKALIWEVSEVVKKQKLVITKAEGDRFRELARELLPGAVVGPVQAITLFFGPGDDGQGGGQMGVQVEEEVE